MNQWCSQISGGNHLLYQLPCDSKFAIRSMPQAKLFWYVLYKTGGKKKACAQMQQTHTSVMFQGMVMKEIMLLPTWLCQEGVRRPASEKLLKSRHVFQRTHSLIISFIQFCCGNHASKYLYTTRVKETENVALFSSAQMIYSLSLTIWQPRQPDNPSLH
jgi:hypothetical protein